MSEYDVFSPYGEMKNENNAYPKERNISTL
jgi:hypothetical protein